MVVKQNQRRTTHIVNIDNYDNCNDNDYYDNAQANTDNHC